jgi:branched-chain amino acid transport system substrate-binding protein
MWNCRVWGVWWTVLVLVLHGCGTTGIKPEGDPRIDFDQYRPAVPSQAHCPGQGDMLTQMQARFAEKSYARALHLAAEIIAAPCTRENYTLAVKIAGDVFAVRNEFDQAFYYYLEGLSHAVDAKEEQMFYDRLQQTAAHLPQEQITAMTKAANARDLERMDLVRESEPEPRKFHSRRIGVMLPLSGYYQAGGERVLNGIQMAVDQHNRSGGKRFELYVQDTRSDPAGVAAAVQRLEKKGVACILGPMVTAGPAAEQAQALEIPMITLSQEAGITDAGAFVFRNFLTPEIQAAGLVSYVMTEAGYDRFAVFYPDDRYGLRFREAFLQAVDAYGGQVTVQAAYAPGQTDFSFQILPLIRGYQKLDAYRNFVDLTPEEPRERNRIYRAKTDFDAVFIPDGPQTAAQISQQLRFHDIREVSLLGTNIWNREALANPGGEPFHQVIFPVDFDPVNPGTPLLQQFVADYEDAFDEPPDYFAAVGFETAKKVMDALSDSQVTSRTRLMQSLKATGFEPGLILEILGAGP